MRSPGTENKIDNDDDDYWLNAIEKIYDASSHDILKSNNQTWIEILGDLGERMVSYLTPQIKIFSDNILFAIEEVDCDPIEEMLIVDELMKYAGYFQNYALLQYNWQLRGCITKGQLYLDEKYLWGPVIKQASELEHRAKNPRIIFDTERLSLPTYEESEVINETDNLEQLIQKDDDMMYYLGYSDIILKGTTILNMPEQRISYLSTMKSSLCELYRSNVGDEQVIHKIKWAIKYHNEVCKRWNVDAMIEL